MERKNKGSQKTEASGSKHLVQVDREGEIEALDIGNPNLFLLRELQKALNENPNYLCGTKKVDKSSPLINSTIAKMLKLLETRKDLSVICVDIIYPHLRLYPEALHVGMQIFINGLIGAYKDENIQTRVQQSFSVMIKCYPFALECRMKDVIDTILDWNSESDSKTAMAFCEFWCGFFSAKFSIFYLETFISRLIKKLLLMMVWSNEESLQDQDQDQGENANETIRRKSSDILKNLLNVSADKVIVDLMSYIEKQLLEDRITLKDEEATIIACGLIGECCLDTESELNDKAMTHMISFLKHSSPHLQILLASKLQYFSKKIIKADNFVDILDWLIKGIIDRNPSLQEAACVTFVTVAKEGKHVASYRDKLQHLVKSLTNISTPRYILDSIRVVVEVFVEDLRMLNVGDLIPLLKANLDNVQQMEENDRLALFNCFLSIVKVDGINCEDAKVIVRSCTKTIEMSDEDVIVGSLRLLSALVARFKYETVAENDLEKLAGQYCISSSSTVRPEAYGLVLAISNNRDLFYGHLEEITTPPMETTTKSCPLYTDKFVSEVSCVHKKEWLLTDHGRILMRLILKKLDRLIINNYVYDPLTKDSFRHDTSDEYHFTVKIYGRKFSLKDLKFQDQNNKFNKMLSAFRKLVLDLCGGADRIPKNVNQLLTLTAKINKWRYNRTLILNHPSIIDRFAFSEKLSQIKMRPKPNYNIYKYVNVTPSIGEFGKRWEEEMEFNWKLSDCDAFYQVMRFGSDDQKIICPAELYILVRNCFDHANDYFTPKLDLDSLNKKVYESFHVIFPHYFHELWRGLAEDVDNKIILVR